jgi:signal transduction histidine kinase
MITASRNQGRVHAASPSLELGPATVGTAEGKRASGVAAGHLAEAIGVARKRALRRRRPRARDGAGVAGVLAEDRRRIAADIHDLIMQDLSFALATARTLAGADPALTERASATVAAGERALEAARALVRDLVSRDCKPVVRAVHEGVLAAARDRPVAFRAAGVGESAQADQPTCDALVHIGREAVTNAIKHAGSSADVEVVFERDDEWRLTVRDNGCGFDPAGAPAGFGLESMVARARALGGSLRVESAAGRGSTIEASLP